MKRGASIRITKNLLEVFCIREDVPTLNPSTISHTKKDMRKEGEGERNEKRIPRRRKKQEYEAEGDRCEKTAEGSDDKMKRREL